MLMSISPSDIHVLMTQTWQPVRCRLLNKFWSALRTSVRWEASKERSGTMSNKILADAVQTADYRMSGFSTAPYMGMIRCLRWELGWHRAQVRPGYRDTAYTRHMATIATSKNNKRQASASD